MVRSHSEILLRNLFESREIWECKRILAISQENYYLAAFIRDKIKSINGKIDKIPINLQKTL